MEYSDFGMKLSGDSGILRLMDDLGRPLPDGVIPRKLGGGNPARIPDVEATYRREMMRILSDGDRFEETISRYDAPQGRASLIDAIVTFFRREYAWDIGPDNVAITNGSQSAFFFLFNLFSGTRPSKKTILFPLVPEYVGYADQGIERDLFVTLPSSVSTEGDHSFKYHIDIPLVETYLSEHPEVGAVCVSRPTNPTGNVLTDQEVASLTRLTQRHGIPLMIDNAYGMPFPNIIFPERFVGEAEPTWQPGVVLSMSLSKIGLPSMRTGIVIADAPVITALSALNSIIALTSGSLGQVLAEDLIRTGEIKTLADGVVAPFYRKKGTMALSWIDEFFSGRNYRVHRSEGAIFLWLYLPDLVIGTAELYGRLKERGVVVVPGEYFFFGLERGTDEETAWKRHPHRERCIRLNYSGPVEDVREGIRIISEVSAKAELRR